MGGRSEGRRGGKGGEAHAGMKDGDMKFTKFGFVQEHRNIYRVLKK